jgi:hypothetical protein
MTPTPVTASIALVVVFEDRARVVRRATVELAAGTHRLVIAGVAPVLADKSLVARAPGAAVHDVRAVRAVAPWRDGHDDDRAGGRGDRGGARRARFARPPPSPPPRSGPRSRPRPPARRLRSWRARPVSSRPAPPRASTRRPRPARLDALTAQLTRHHQAAAAAGEDAAVAPPPPPSASRPVWPTSSAARSARPPRW